MSVEQDARFISHGIYFLPWIGVGFQANKAGLKGAAVAVWDAGSGKMGFLGPPQWHPFLSSISLHFVMANLNKKISR